MMDNATINPEVQKGFLLGVAGVVENMHTLQSLMMPG